MKSLVLTVLFVSATLVAADAKTAGKGNSTVAGPGNCPAGTAWSSFNQQCSKNNFCWQKLKLPRGTTAQLSESQRMALNKCVSS